MVIEGIILSKTPHQDRHMILNILEKSGKKSSIYCFGGAGGGKKQKNSLLDVGQCFQWTLSSFGKSSKGIPKSKEWKLIWQYKKIRANYKLFLLLCSYVQLVKVVAPEDISDEASASRLYALLASSLFQLENLESPDLQNYSKLTGLFLAKLIYLAGLSINTQSCVHSNGLLKEASSSGLHLRLNIQEGGFYILDHQRDHDDELFSFLAQAYSTKIGEFRSLSALDMIEVKKLLQYFCFHQNLEPRNFILFDF